MRRKSLGHVRRRELESLGGGEGRKREGDIARQCMRR